MPAALIAEATNAFKDITAVILAFERATPIARSTSNVLRSVCRDVGKTVLANVDKAWATAWVRRQKLEQHRAPCTIRRHDVFNF